MTNILEENRSLGWARLPESAPEFVRRFVTEFRTARIEKRSMSDAFLRTFNGEAESRCTALGRSATTFVNRLFPQHAVMSDAALAKRYGVSIEKVQEMRLRVKLDIVGREILADSVTEKAISEWRRENFPWEVRD